MIDLVQPVQPLAPSPQPAAGPPEVSVSRKHAHTCTPTAPLRTSFLWLTVELSSFVWNHCPGSSCRPGTRMCNPFTMKGGTEMGPSKFDELTKLLATSTSRRQALKAITATTIGGVLGLG